MTKIIQTAPLEAQAQTQCTQCGGTIWLYTTYGGVQVALDEAPGPVVIDGLGKAFITEGHDGYREHECRPETDRFPLNEVTDDDFLWP